MTSNLVRYSLPFAVVLLALTRLSASEPFLEKTNLFEEETDGFVCYRIPGIVVTARGTVLAYCEARKFSTADRGEIEIHLRRSTDGGRSWDPPQQVAHIGPRLPRNPYMSKSKKHKELGGPNEQTVNNAVAIAGNDGIVHLIYCIEYMRCFYIRSKDDGITWSRPVDITSTFDNYRTDLEWQVIATGPGHAIQLKSGRLVVPFWMSTYKEDVKLKKAVGVIYSDDDGNNWERGDLALRKGGEPNIAELADGCVMITARNGDPRNRRMVTFSRDGATSWSKPEFIEPLLEPGCMAGIVSHPGTVESKPHLLLFSNPDTTNRAHKNRENLTIKLSEDGGRTWPVSRVLQPGPSAYSDLAVLNDGTILCFYESGDPQTPRKHGRRWAYSFLTVARFNLQWLTNGKHHEGE
ncbi:sialidase family protein [Adhaeretor mobilis]|uniref:exo-alpha-sialidase n=1 Tax=Adhaeretor mobilis TaxID=1930276 RepID=A0A517MVA7_9BACT|nr:sialidase family protein [Adhaeretor mobilis]QDS98824.1 Sialidase precursor [Adhaeretor mobilis]